MATKYYRGNNSDWNTDANWSTTSGGAADTTFPTSSDDAIFDANSGNCTLDANAACLSLTIGTNGSLYTGTLDAGSSDVAIGSGGLDCTYGGSATLDLGSGTWTVTGGDFDYQDIGTLDDGASTVVMAGTGNIRAKHANNLYNLTIDSGATTTVLAAGGSPYIVNLLTVDGTLDLSGELLSVRSGANAVVNAGGEITGTGSLHFLAPGGGNGLLTMDGTISVAIVYWWLPVTGAALAPGTYDCGLFQAYNTSGSATVFQPSNGSYVFGGDFLLQNTSSGSLTLDNSNDPDFTLQGDVTVDEQAGTIAWNPGSGTITFDGTANRDVDFNSLAVEAIVVDMAAGTWTLTGAVSTASFTATDGDLDLNGQTITSAGAFGLASGVTVADPVGSTINTDTFTADGQAGLNASGTWNLNATSSATISNATVAYLDASGGVEVDATNNCVEGPGCVNVDFGAAVPWHLFQLQAA